MIKVNSCLNAQELYYLPFYTFYLNQPHVKKNLIFSRETVL